VVKVFDRFGQVSFDAVPLERLGLEKRWKKLASMQAEAQDLIARYQEAAQKVAEIEQGRAEARDRDLDLHAEALRKGEEMPDPEHEANLNRELASAVRTRDALQRATEGAIADVNRYRAEHASRLQRDVAEALGRTATTLAQRARETSNLYAEYQAVEQDLRRLTPRAPQPENTGAPQDVAHLIGPMGTRVVSGPNPGEIQAVLDYLASLAPATVIEGAA
jgi:chromosome segregation ATPase